jgi:uncharacterized membrane protein AbrB (regulator of aidB expression)
MANLPTTAQVNKISRRFLWGSNALNLLVAVIGCYIIFKVNPAELDRAVGWLLGVTVVAHAVLLAIHYEYIHQHIKAIQQVQSKKANNP